MTPIFSGNSMPAFTHDTRPIQEELNYITWEETQEYIRSKTKRKSNPETKLVKTIIAWLKAHGCVAIRVNSGAFKATYNGKTRYIQANSQEGCSDIIACVPYENSDGGFCAIEVKTKTGRVNPKQQAFLQRVIDSGGIAFVARSVADVERELSWLQCNI